MHHLISRLCAVLLLTLAHAAEAQTSVSTTLGITADEDSNAGAFGGLDLLFSDSDWLSGSIGINRPTDGFEDSRSLTAGLDYGHAFDVFSLSAGFGYGDREGFTSKRVRGSLQWQSERAMFGVMLEESRIDATTYVSGLNRIVRLEDDFSVSGAGARLGLYGSTGLSLDLSYMAYDEPAGLRFRNVDQLSNRLLSAEIDRLLSDGRRIDPVRIEQRINTLQPSYSNATSVLSDSFALSLGLRHGTQQFAVDYYVDTYALVDASMRTWDLRWMLPLSSENNLVEFWGGSSELEGTSTAFGGIRFIFYR